MLTILTEINLQKTIENVIGSVERLKELVEIKLIKSVTESLNKTLFVTNGSINSSFVCIFKLSIGFSGWLAGVILESTNYQPNEIIQNSETLEGLFIMGYIFPAVAGTIAMFIMAFHRYDSNFYDTVFSSLRSERKS